MNRSRSATSIIWSTVVSAAAMLGTPACHKDAAQPTTPVPVEETPVATAPPVEEAAPPPVEQAAPPVEEPAPPPAPEQVNFEIVSTPVGAEVYRDGELLGTTPLVMAIAKSEDAMTFEVKLAGYKDKSITLKASADQHLEFALAKAPRIRGTGSKKTGRGFVLG